MTTKEKKAKNNREGFTRFLLERNPSPKFIRTYEIYLCSQIVKKYTKEVVGTDNIFEISKTDDIRDIYTQVKWDENNIRLHNVYSGAVSAYCKYLEGRPLRIKARKKAPDEAEMRDDKQ
jgi:hypothetical protein